ncbi:SDR family NAD(P)-dependent oxidoreductase [Rhodococcus opacus]|uniref:SDR family NAD(P)-dependent oxidoreductase n=1 Tax=Rhodococcus opacus TaxID=37919 RepID=UPI000A45E222|nr:SDR family NAD(P)-dependent oxidoreductase [Rhodococcus opacus]
MSLIEDRAGLGRVSEFEGRVALVTGGAGHVGSSMVRSLATAGAHVAVAHHSGGEAAERLVGDIRRAGGTAVAVQADLGDPDAVDRLVDNVGKDLGPIDILVANAGVGKVRSWKDVGPEEFDDALAINLRAPYLLARKVLPSMTERSWGRILFVSSIAAMLGGPFGPDYSASKAALHGLVHYFAPQVAAQGVTVNVLAPALMGEHSVAMMDAEVGQAIAASIPVGRIGAMEELADYALAVLRNGYLTNKVLPIDGGMFAH